MPIPSTGAFRIFPRVAAVYNGPFSLSSTGAPPPVATQAQVETYFESQVSDPPNAPRVWENVLDGIYVPTPGIYSIEFSPNTAEIMFDAGGTPTIIDFLSASFPLGVMGSQLRVWWNGTLTSEGRNLKITRFKMKYFGSTLVDLINPATTSVPISSLINDIIPFGSRWGFFNIFKNFTFEVTIEAFATALLDRTNLLTSLFFLEGLYQTTHFSITVSEQNASPGAEITITDTLNNLLVFSSFKVYWKTRAGETESVDVPGMAGGVLIPNSFIITHIAGTLKFRIPLGLGIPYGGRKLILMGIGTGGSFFGSVPLAYFNYQLVNGSGLYTLVKDKRNDTYYDRSVSPVVTIDLKIPDPFVKTGFFNG